MRQHVRVAIQELTMTQPIRHANFVDNLDVMYVLMSILAHLVRQQNTLTVLNIDANLVVLIVTSALLRAPVQNACQITSLTLLPHAVLVAVTVRSALMQLLARLAKPELTSTLLTTHAKLVLETATNAQMLLLVRPVKQSISTPLVPALLVALTAMCVLTQPLVLHVLLVQPCSSATDPASELRELIEIA